MEAQPSGTRAAAAAEPEAVDGSGWDRGVLGGSA